MSEKHGSIGGLEPAGPSLAQLALKLIGLAGCIYLFILSISLLGASFKLFGKEFSDFIFQSTTNPIIGLMIGILGTSVLQSSSATTSMVVGLAGSGVLTLEASIPIIMGANIGTSITNSLVSLAHISRAAEFRRAVAGALLHDYFNVCAVIVLMPFQIAFNFIGKTAVWLESSITGMGGVEFKSPLKMITKP